MTEALTPPSLVNQPTYLIRRFTEQSEPALVAEALRIHAAGYLSMGFLNNQALTDDGFVHPDIDRSRGKTTEYYLANNTSIPTDCATLRKVRLRPGGSIADFDCYDLCRSSLFPDALAQFARMCPGSQSVVEISSLARMPGASPAAVWHLLRAAVCDSMARRETWFCCIVVSTYSTLARHMGPRFMRILGGDVAIEDGRVNSGVVLRPVAIDTSEFFDAMLVDHGRTTGRTQHRIERSLLFYTEGADDNLLSPAVATFRDKPESHRLGTADRP